MQQLTRSVVLTPPPLSKGQTSTELVLAWRSPTEVVVVQWIMEMPHVVSMRLVIVDMYAGTIVTAPFPVPEGAREVIVLNGEGLAIGPTLQR